VLLNSSYMGLDVGVMGLAYRAECLWSSHGTRGRLLIVLSIWPCHARSRWRNLGPSIRRIVQLISLSDGFCMHKNNGVLTGSLMLLLNMYYHLSLVRATAQSIDESHLRPAHDLTRSAMVHARLAASSWEL
jgi:hypothetical protein